MKTLDKYLAENFQRGVIDHALRAHVDEGGEITFYIHPANVDGDTLDFGVLGNSLYPNPKIIRQGE